MTSKEKKEEKEETGEKEGRWLELADFIRITAPTNPEWHDNLFFISYIDENIIEVIELLSNRIHLLQIQNRQFIDHSIEKISVVSRSSLKGYARQNGLFPHIWVDIYFGGELPKSITAEIRHLEEDMIELRSYPENKILFLDFAYQGVPRHLPIERICIREKPASYSRAMTFGEADLESEGISEGDNEGTMEYTREGMIDIVLPPNVKPDETLQERLKKIEIRFLADEELPEITQFMEAAPELQRFGLEAQINDLLDAFLSTVPDYKRTPMVMHRIYTHIQRFKELRESFSTFDPTFHTILGPKKSNPKPLIQELANLTARIAWVLPVVNQTKKVYFLAEDGPLLSTLVPEIDQKNMSIDAQNESILEKRLFYENNTPSADSTVKYANMYLETADYYRPFSSTSIVEEDIVVSSKIHTVEVKRDMDVLVSNGQENDLLSTFSTDDNIGRTKFVRNRYNAEINYPYKRNVKSKEPSLFAPLFPADSLDFRSLVLLPKPFISFSKIQLPNTSIYQKSELHLAYPYLTRFLGKKGKKGNVEVEDREISTSAASQTTLSNTHIKHLYTRQGGKENTNSLESFLNKCIPDIDVILDTYISTTFSKKAFTFTQMVDALEPFLIYMEHVSWKSAKKIKGIINKHIDAWNTSTNLKSELFKSLLLEKYKSEIGEPRNVVLESIAEKDKGLKDVYSEIWSKMKSSSEFFRMALDEDQSRLFSCMIQRISSELYVPENMLPSLDDWSDSSSFDQGKGNGRDCWKRVITKKYKAIADLTADNGRFIHYDKEFDKTDYALMEKYKAEQPELDATGFLNFLAENMIAKHGYSRDRAFQEARNMIAGERPVEEGEYAVLFLLPHLNSEFSKDTLTEKDKEEVKEEADVKKRVMYFIRKGNTWVHVAELDELSFIDNPTLFCNLQENCFGSSSSSKEKKKSDSTCENQQMTKERMHYQNKERMESEFKDRYELSVEDFTQKIKGEEEKWMLQREKQEKGKYSLVDATAASLASRAILSDIIFSPYLTLRDRILQKTLDVNTKHHYILLFVERFCREPLTDEPMRENAHWFYCKETNTPLFPKSLFQLAKADKEGKYIAVLNQLCNTIGKVSDDGDAYVDKYSGYLLRKIESQEEQYQGQGTTDAEGEDIGETDSREDRMDFTSIKHRTNATIQRIFINEIDQKIYNLITSICRNIYVIGEENKDKMMQLCQKWLKNAKLFISQEKYQKQYDLKIEKRKQDPKLKIPDTFETYQKKQHIIIAVLSVLIIVQTAVPEMSIKRTFPGCVKSFSGYPLRDGQDDLSSIHYMACVLKKMYATNKEENHLLPKKETEFVTILVNTLKDVILIQPDILHLYDVKREFLRTRVSATGQDLEEERGVTNQWSHFLPPMLAFHIPNASIEMVSPSGNRYSHILNVYRAKTQSLMLCIVEYIREIITRKNILFQTKSGKAYTINACCEELLAYPPKSVLEYFQEEDAAIAKIVEILRGVTKKIATHQEKGKALVLLKEKMVFVPGSGSGSGSEERKQTDKKNPIFSYEPAIFYAALIHYAKLGSEIYPIPADLEPIVSKKPRDWITTISMPEKIELLEKQQIRTDARKTIHLMNIVHQRNPVSIVTTISISPENRIKMAIEDFVERNADIPYVHKIAQKWMDSLEKEEEQDPKHSFDFEKENLKMQKEWFSFMERNAQKKPTNVEIKKRSKFIYDWTLYESIPLSNLILYQKSLIYRIGILFPSYLHSNMQPPEIPKHWELIPSDISLLKKNLQTYKTILKPFQKEDLLVPIYENLVERIQPLMDFMEYAIYLKNDKNDQKEKEEEDKKKYIFDVSLFCMHISWMIYIGLIDNKDIYKIITNQIREKGIARIEEKEIDNYQGDLDLDEDQDLDPDLEEVNITTVQIENKALIQQKMGDLFLAIIDTLKTKKQTNVKEPATMTYADIMREIDYSKDREKQKIKKYFTDMSVEERKAELVLKKLHLGIFAIDNKKINKYGKNTGLFGDRDMVSSSSEKTTEEEKAIVEAEEEKREGDIEDSVEYQNMIREEDADPDRDIFQEEEDEDLDVFFGERVEDEEDYEDINEYARDNEE